MLAIYVEVWNSLADMLDQWTPRWPPCHVEPSILAEAIKDSIKVDDNCKNGKSWLDSENIQAFASLIGAVSWPITALIFAAMFRTPILTFISGLTDVEIAGAKFRRLQKELNAADAEAARKKEALGLPTEAEQARAVSVHELLEGIPSLIRREAETLAYEYENVRASMPAGNERTRRMEIVVAKMRTLGRAVFPLRHEFASSSSPGKRLQAIAALQVEPDYDMLDWLVDRLKLEKPFIVYHALVGLLQAARVPEAKTHRAKLEKALETAEAVKDTFGSDTDRFKMLALFEQAIARLND